MICPEYTSCCVVTSCSAHRSWELTGITNWDYWLGLLTGITDWDYWLGLLTGSAPVWTLRRPERLHAQPRHRRPRWSRMNPGVPAGQMEQAAGRLLGDGMVMTAGRPGGSTLRRRRRRLFLGSWVGAEEHLKNRKTKNLRALFKILKI